MPIQIDRCGVIRLFPLTVIAHLSPSLEDRGWIIVLTSKMLTCGNPATDDRSDRDNGHAEGTSQNHQTTGRSLPHDIRAEAGIPSRRQACLEADQVQGVHVEHPAAERHGPPAPGRLRLRRRRDGIPAPWCPPLSSPSPGAIPERGPPEARVLIWSLETT